MRRWVTALAPLLLVGTLLALFFIEGPPGIFQKELPPIEALTFERVVLPEPDRIEVIVVNGGPDPVTIAQVMVDEALWKFSAQPPNRTLGRLASMKLEIPYPWVEGESHEITLLTSTGATFSYRIGVATASPARDWSYLGRFALLGFYAGVIPVFAGLLWYPFLRGLERAWLDFFLSLTVGLLVFLAVDTVQEALQVSGRVAGAYQGVGLFSMGLLGTLLLLLFVSRSKRRAGGGTDQENRCRAAWMIALGIGLHNLGEGLAMGSAYAIGELAMGAFLVMGFTLHNLTEGLGIVAPIATTRPSLKTLAALGTLAGFPTILGAWMGGFSYSPLWATLFLAAGAGAIVQVILEILRVFGRRGEGLLTAHNVTGFLTGMGLMYATGLLVVV